MRDALPVAGLLGAAISLGVLGACGSFGAADAATTPSDAATNVDASDEATSSDGGADPTDAGCNADLTSDPSNCGWCGHACKAAACIMSQCAPSKIVDGIKLDEAIKGLAINTAMVFWYSVAGTVYACPKTGCPSNAPIQLFASAGISSIAADDTNLYAIREDSPRTLVACAVGGCSGAPAMVSSGLGYVGDRSLVATTHDLFWVEAAAGLMRVSKSSGGAPTPIAPIGGGALTTYASLFYWAGAFETIVACDAAGNSTRLASGMLNSVAAGPGGIFWADGQDEGTISALPLKGGQPASFAKSQYRPAGVVTDAAAVYWFTSSVATGVVKRAGVVDRTPVDVASSQDSPVELQVDDEWIYWANSASLWRVPK
jgi:hypothetical protein